MRVSALCGIALSGVLLAASVGAAWAAEIILYDHRNFGGRSLTLNLSAPDLDDYDFDNEVSAVKVISGTWELFRDDNYESNHGPSKVLGPGEYPNLSHVDFRRNKLSSVRLISDDDNDNGQTQPDCPGPYHVLANDGRCVWSCSQGTQPGPSGECECQPGLVETSQDQLGRRVCTAPPQTPPPPEADCISFDWRDVEARNVNGRWLLTEGNRSMLEFGNNQAEANRSRSIIQHYRMNKRCFVGRPNASMTYWLVDGQAPSGGFQSEDCVRFNLAQTEVRQVRGSWKIVEGSHGIMDFGANRDETKESLIIMEQYGFNRMCFVGRPDPSMIYYRR